MIHAPADPTPETTTTATILIVDDTAAGRDVLASLLANRGYQLEFASSGREALNLATALNPDLILLDIMMPGMDGFEVCQILRSQPDICDIPILMVTALDDRESRIRGLEVGADDFISKPFDRVELRTRVQTITRLNRYRRLHTERRKFQQIIEHSPDGLAIVSCNDQLLLINPTLQRLLNHSTPTLALGQPFAHYLDPTIHHLYRSNLHQILQHPNRHLNLETQLLTANATAIPIEITFGSILWNDDPAIQLIVRDITQRRHHEAQIHDINQRLTQAYDTTLQGWARALELRDIETKGHSDRVTRMTVDLARLLGHPEADIVQIRRGALLHDIGKLAIPDSILLKNGPLSEDEWGVMRQHPGYARDMLMKINYLHPAIDIPYCHHEKWDGSGYPRGLRGEEIPLSARIFTFVDVWDALASDRPYRHAWPRDRIIAYIRQQSGLAFQPDLVPIFLDYIEGYTAGQPA
mgnify:CR=1 FL=1